MITLYGRDDDITRMVDVFDWYFVPVANPDGYEYSMTAVSQFDFTLAKCYLQLKFKGLGLLAKTALAIRYCRIFRIDTGERQDQRMNL